MYIKQYSLILYTTFLVSLKRQTPVSFLVLQLLKLNYSFSKHAACALKIFASIAQVEALLFK